VSTVLLDCADDVPNAPVRVLGGPCLLATSRLSRFSINILQNLTELPLWPTVKQINNDRPFILALNAHSHFKYAPFCFTVSSVSCHALFFIFSVLIFVLCMGNTRRASIFLAEQVEKREK
jgi:hypothetical protein